VAPHGADKLAAFDDLTFPDFAFVQVTVEGVDHLNFATRFAVSVADDHHIAPADFYVLAENDHTVANAVDGVTEIGISTANTIPVFAKVTIRPEAAGFVIPFGIATGRAYGEIKSVRQVASHGFHGLE